MKDRKNIKNGITLILLLFIIAIIIILSGSVIVTGSEALNKNKKVKFATELALVQEAVDNYKIKNSGNYPVFTNSNITVSDAMLYEGTTDTASSTYQEIDLTLIGITENAYGTNDDDTDKFIVSTSTGNVYYLKGETIKEKQYFSLKGNSETAIDLRDSINYMGSDSTIASQDGIFFSSSTNDFAKEVTVTVRYPDGATINSIDGATITAVDANTSRVVMSKNGIISVVYNGITRTYNVTNVDNDTPSLVFNTSLVTVGEYNYFKIVDKQETTTSVELIKYYYGNVEPATLKERNDCYTVSNDMIEVKSGVKYITVYAEDKAGNSVGYKFRVDGNNIVAI